MSPALNETLQEVRARALQLPLPTSVSVAMRKARDRFAQTDPAEVDRESLLDAAAEVCRALAPAQDKSDHLLVTVVERVETIETPQPPDSADLLETLQATLAAATGFDEAITASEDQEQTVLAIADTSVLPALALLVREAAR